ncbi:sugar ABC transporter ATP-binding protein [Oscillospiraceae bacterium MB08-C2-2]|nr:sugar ABC transporter ATP-binding protein [Oscillospiraceae bacterium MB08-C2-2]
MEHAVLLEMKNISKSFPGVRALSNVSFSVHKGEIMALMGENGAGKSTLIKIITGLYRKDEGEMIFQGEPVHVGSPLEAQRLGISTIYQELNLSPFLSIAENIYLGNAPKKFGSIDWKKMRADAKKAMAELGVDVDVSKPLNRYSTAIQQMVAIARALSIDTKLLVMDEATSSLDARETQILFDVVTGLKERGISTVFITHRMDEVYRICDNITILKDGEFVGCYPAKELSKLELVSKMIGRDATDLVNKKKEYQPEKQKAEVLCEVKAIKCGHRLNGVDLIIRKGEVVGLAGLLGSGRTELAKVIFGDDVQYEGEIFYGGQAVRFKDPSDAIKKGEAFCTEDRKVEGIFPNLSIMDNISITVMGRISRFGIVNRAKQLEIANEYIKKIDIRTPSAMTRIKNLSGGNQQKVVLSKWLVTKPQLIIMDEPTRGIDVGAKGEIEALIQQISNQGISVLYISSEIEELVRGCDRVVILQEGRKKAEIVGDAISERNIMKAIAESGPEDTPEGANLEVNQWAVQ